MKRLAMLMVYVTVGSTPTVINIPDGSWMAIVPKETLCDTVVVSSAVVLSTGPVIMKAVSGDCYSIPYLQPNGTPPKLPLDWVPCP